MPTYQYHCPDCGHDFEKFQSMTDDPLDKCPRCGEKPRRIISGGAGFLFKGSGFYQTDYRSSQYKADAKKDSSSPSAPESTAKNSTKSESKPSSGKES